MKVSRSLKLMRGAGIRTRKLARDMLVFWKRVDKEMVLLYNFLFSVDFFLALLICMFYEWGGKGSMKEKGKNFHSKEKDDKNDQDLFVSCMIFYHELCLYKL